MKIQPDIEVGADRFHKHSFKRLEWLAMFTVLGLLTFAETPYAATHYVDLNSPNPTPPYTNWATAATVIQAAVDAAVAGDEIVVTNGVYATGGRAVAGFSNRVAIDKPLSMRSINGPQFTTIDGGGAGRCVYLTNAAILAGFTVTNGWIVSGNGWVATGGGVLCESSLTVVSNCFLVRNVAAYSGGGAEGGTLIECTLTGNSSTYGGGASQSLLTRCTLIGNGVSDQVGFWGASGGGAESCVLNDCILLSNSAYAANNSFGYFFDAAGGGADGCVLNNCLLVGNSVSSYDFEETGFGSAAGGGVSSSTLNNCTLVNNSAASWQYTDVFGESAGYSSGGGAYSSQLNNCIVYSNSAEYDPEYDYLCALSYCCTTPTPANGLGNITNAPLFVDLAGGNLRLQSNSPCINAGNNAYASTGTDLDGNPRISGGTVDIGAYEFQNPTSLISYAWLQQFGLPTDGSADFTDPDHDGMNNWQEWRCGTDPTSALSALRLLRPTIANTNVTLTWQSVAGVNYFLERSMNLAAPGQFAPIATNIIGQSGTTTYTDTNAVGPGPFFYRVGVGD